MIARLAVLLTLAVLSPAAAQLTNGLTAYWNFDDNLADQAHGASGTASATADDLVFQGTAAGFTTAGKFGSAYSNPTGGTGHAETADSADVEPGSGAISISAWFRVNAFDTSWQALIVKGEATNYRLHRAASTDSIAWYDGNGEIGQGGPGINDGNWHHIVVTQDPANGSAIYVDGSPVATDPAGGTHNDGPNPLMIGENPDANGRHWNGDIDDVGIWHRALTAAEVTQIWNGGAGTPLSNFLVVVDNDGDGLPQWWENANGLDDDDDGTINPVNGPAGDPDMDLSGNLAEYTAQTDPQNPDTDADGLNDGPEAANGTDPLAADTDGDGLDDGPEVLTHGTNPLLPDTEGDTMDDGWEVANNLDPLADDTGLDPDNDGATNLQEFTAGSDPQNPQSDGDGLNDGAEINSHGTDPTLNDTDADGLSDGDEINTHGTDPTLPDTDGDGFNDGFEITQGTDPLNNADFPNGLLLYYSFDNVAGTAVTNEAGGTDGTLVGGATITAGQTGYGDAFLGNRTATDDARVDTNLTAIDLAIAGNSYTAMAWVYWLGAGGNNDHMVFSQNPASGILHHGIRDNGGTNIAHFGHWGNDVNDAGVIPPNTWVHVAYTYDGTTGRVYLDGALTGSGNVGGLISGAHGENIVIGYMGGRGSFNGLIDEVKIFNTVLNGSSITAQMPPPGPPVANDDAVTMHRDGKVLFDVLSNDTGGIAPATLQLLSGPAHGTATANPDGTVLYSHTTGTPATDTITYQIDNFDGSASDVATITVTFSSAYRFPTNYAILPPAPPVTALGVEDAFPGLTFDSPHDFSAIPGDSGKLLVAEGDGRVYLVPDVTANPTDADKLLILDVTTQTNHDNNEKAFKSVAPHPNWAANGYIYCTYNTTSGTSRLSRFTCQTTSPYAALASSEQILIDQADSGAFHNIDTAEFGPDGYLYVGLGDEGTQSDGYSNSQYIDKDIWSGIIRIDVDKKPGSLVPNPDSDVPRVGGGTSGEAFYAIPPDNPFIGFTSFNGVAVDPNQVRTELFIVGLRNPWQFYLEDSDNNGTVDEVWVGDVGRGAPEEINVFAPGENGGWSWRQGPGSVGSITGDHNGALEANATLTGPLWAYPHGGGAFAGNSVTAGYLYKDTAIASLTGKFLAADYISGNIWAIDPAGGTPVIERLGGETAIVALEPDPSGNGDVLLLDRGNTGGSQGTGGIKRLAVGTDDSGFPQTLADTGFFADLTDLSPQPGAVAYEPNLRFWSDFSEKSRWFLIKNTTDAIGYSRDGNWTYPADAIWVKHFDLPTEWETFNRTINGQAVTDRRPAPGSPRRRLETRFLVKTATAAYGISYRWNNINGGAQTNATIADNNGESFNVDVTIDAAPSTVPWDIPARSSCLDCHTTEAGYALSFNTRQLNRAGSIAGVPGNFLDMLDTAGYLTGFSDDPAGLPRLVRPDETTYSLEARFRSYLAVNCAYCHRSGGTGGGNWDGRAHLTLAQTGLVNGTPVDAPLNPGDLLVIPGNVSGSILYNRTAAANGYTRMPPIATNEIDLEGAQLLADWIAQELQPHTSYQEWRIANFGNGTSAEGDPSANPDGDPGDNYFEWLTNTNPLDHTSSWQPVIRPDGAGLAIDFAGLGNRRVTVERSTSLQAWSDWLVPGNDGIPFLPGTVHTLGGPMQEPGEFFRFRIEEF